MTEKFVANIAEIPWEEYPGHFGGALSKALVQPKTCNSKLVDFRISSYQPMAYVAEHTHEVQEQIYYVLEGEGILTLGKDKRVMRRNDYAFMPPGLPHSFTNTGLGSLVFLVVTTPVEDRHDAI